MTRPSVRRGTALGALLALTASPLGGVLAASTPAIDSHDVSFTRSDIDTAVQGAAFTVVGEIFPGEQNVVTTGYGALAGAVPAGGGTLQVYRKGSDLSSWTRVEVFGAGEGIVFPNRPTVADMDGDGDNDIVQPSGYFFDTNPANPGGAKSRSAITWWENQGLDDAGTPREFIRHDVITGQPGSYHGVELADLDADGVTDIISTAEAGRVSDDQYDDTVTLQFFKGRTNGTFEAPVALSDKGGSLPVVADVDGDGRLDIVSSQYFDLTYWDTEHPSFMWFRQSGDASGGLTAAHFTQHTIATATDAGFGFQIRPVPNFREPGKVSWIGANHQGRCFFQRVVNSAMPDLRTQREMVMEFVPGDDLTKPWAIKELSVPENQPADPDACDPSFNKASAEGPVPIHPTDGITARSAGGQAAPGVFGYGDIDADGDVDLLVSGDGDRRLFWIEQLADTTSGPDTRLHTLTGAGETFGQSGGAVVADLDGDGKPELLFSSFDANTVALWRPTVRPGEPTTPTPKPVVTVKSKLKVTPAPAKVVRNKRATWKVQLIAAKGGPARKVVVTFKPAKGKAVKVRTLTLRPNGKGVRTTKLTWRTRKPGVLTFRYAGTKVSPTLKDTSAKTTSRVKVRRR